jgi:hypothetical protein
MSLGIWCACLTLAGRAHGAAPVGTAFTFQGRVAQNGIPLSAGVDFQFRLYDQAALGNQIGPQVNLPNQPVKNGMVQVVLDFGPVAFPGGQARWLEIDVRHPTGVGGFTTLAPRQEMTPAPYALGLSLPYLGSLVSNGAGGVFEIDNNGLGWAGVFRNNNPANTDAALNVTSLGSLAASFLNDSGGTAIQATSTISGKAIEAQTPGVAQGSVSVHGLITSANAGMYSAAVRGENKALGPSTYGVFGSSAGSGWGILGRSLSGRGVHGEVTDDFGFGVFGVAAGPSGTGVYGLHSGPAGQAAGVHGVTNSAAGDAAGVWGQASSPDARGSTVGVLGETNSANGAGVKGRASATGVHGIASALTGSGVRGEATGTKGEGVHGEGATGVYGKGDASGITGEAGDSSSFGVWAIGSGGALSQPALRADNQSGPGIYALGSRAIEGEGTEFGVRGITFDPNGVGGSFTNFDANGTALRVTGKAVVDGRISVRVLEILGGADIAERFEVGEGAKPGLVVVIDAEHPGRLLISRQAYDRRVVGVISGANKLDAGVVLGNQPPAEGVFPVALSGRVWVHCTAEARAVEPGDFITTSDLPGLAMPVLDRDRADGAMIGKAMSRLKLGQRGLVLVLVNLK